MVRTSVLFSIFYIKDNNPLGLLQRYLVWYRLLCFVQSIVGRACIKELWIELPSGATCLNVRGLLPMAGISDLWFLQDWLSHRWDNRLRWLLYIGRLGGYPYYLDTTYNSENKLFLWFALLAIHLSGPTPPKHFTSLMYLRIMVKYAISASPWRQKPSGNHVVPRPVLSGFGSIHLLCFYLPTCLYV